MMDDSKSILGGTEEPVIKINKSKQSEMRLDAEEEGES